MEVVDVEMQILQVDADIDLVALGLVQFYQFNSQENRCGWERGGMA